MDDLNDLVWTSPPSSAKSPTLQPSSRTGSPFSAFDALANTSNRSYSPAPSFNAPASSSNLRPTPAASAPRPGASSDAFASLLSMGSSSSNGGSLSMAEKAAKLADESKRKQEAEAKAFAGHGAFWDKFDGGSSGVAPLGAPVRAQGTGGGLAVPAVTGPARISSPSLVPSRPTSSASNTISTSTSSIPRSSTPLASSSNDLWSEFDMLSAPAASSSVASVSSKPAAAQSAKTATNGAAVDSFDSFDMFEDLTVTSKPPVPASSRSTPTSERTPRTRTPGDHDFGDREDRDDDGWGGAQGGNGLLAGNESDEDDFMGAFNRPAKPASSRSQPATSHQPSTTTSSRRPPSPPPHILGQIVEMGFSLAQARNALASTPTGLDVQVALEMLLSESRTPAPSRSQQASPSNDAAESDDSRSRREEEEAAERRRRRRRGPTRDSPATTPAAVSGSSTPLDGLSAAQIQDQASKLLAQTNLLGQSMFNRANAFWKEGKTQVQKAYEERQVAGGGSAAGAGGKAADGRPKWMVDAEAFEIEEREAAAGGSGGGFRDGDDDGEERGQRSNGKRPARQASPPRQQQQRLRDPVPAPVMSAAAKVASLFGGDSEPTAYVSPNRRRPGPAAPVASSSAPPSRPTAVPSRPAAPLRRRQVAPAPPSSIAAAASHRTKGNDLFKLGRFGDAEAAYSSAIDSLPPKHLLAVPLLNNRAAARLKNGDHVGCAADSTTVIEIVGLDYDPEKEVPTDEEQGGAGLGEALVKAFTKRASAYEMGEKWSKAKEDWELLGTLSVGRAVGKASKIPAMDGARRCKKMVDVVSGVAPSQSSSAPTSRPAPRVPPAATVRPPKPTPAPNSAAEGPALARARATASLATSEEAQRADLKDAVEARLSAWSTNKETNLRALLASLDTVLWPELGWQKCGMHELVTDKQVKVRYTRAIGKVHPDKLASLGAGVTVEQRMVAGGVFGVLNEAWRVSQA